MGAGGRWPDMRVGGQITQTPNENIEQLERTVSSVTSGGSFFFNIKSDTFIRFIKHLVIYGKITRQRDAYDIVKDCLVDLNTMTQILAKLQNIFKNHPLTFSVCEHRKIILSRNKFVAPFCFNHVKSLDSSKRGINKP